MTELIKRLGGKSYLEKRAKASMKWIRTSFDANENKGSSAFLSPIKGWSFAYPETTGYLLPTLHQYHSHFEDKRVKKLLVKQIDF